VVAEGKSMMSRQDRGRRFCAFPKERIRKDEKTFPGTLPEKLRSPSGRHRT